MDNSKIILKDWAEIMKDKGKMSTRLYNAIILCRSKTFEDFIKIKYYKLDDVDMEHIADLRNGGKKCAEEFNNLKLEYYSKDK